MKKFLILGSFIVYTSSFAFVPLSNQQTSVSSFRSLATMGMFYDELDIISAHPVSLLEFSGNTLYTTWGNIRGINNTNRIVSYYSPAAVVDNTFVFGLCGDALSNFNIKNSRMGFVFQNLGAKTNYFNLDNITGLDSEGVWKDIISENVDNSADGSIDREQIFESSMKNYANRKMNQFNVGFAKKGLNFGKFRNVIAGVSISRQSDYTHRITEGIKSYKRRYLTDNGLPSGWPSGIRVGDTYELNYADNDILVNSFDITDILAQARISNFFLTGLRLDLGIGLRVRNDYNPTSLIKNADTVAISDDKLNNAGNGVVYDYRFAKRNVSLATGGQLNYDDFTGLQGDFLLTNLWRPAWAGGIDAPGLEDFSDNRGGFGFLLRTEAGYRLFNIPLTGVFNFSITPQKLDRKEVYKDYIKIQTYNTTQQNDPKSIWVARDFTEVIKQTGDVVTTQMDIGVKLDFVKAEYLDVTFGGFISTQYQLQDYTQSRHSVEITSYDDGIPGNTPGNVGINTRPSSTNGEGMWSQTRTSKSDNKQEIYTLNISMPIGAEIPLTKKWLFRAGSVYNMTKTTTISKRTSEKVKTTTSVTPAGGATTVETSIVDPTTDYINEGTIYTETHQVLYAYGIEWKPNKNLIIACNAFLDTNTNPTGGKSSILDLDTYRLLAMQVVVKF